jgi:rare lipoprotein A
MISCQTTTDSSRSLSGAHDTPGFTSFAFLRNLFRLTVALLFLTISTSGSAMASYDRHSLSTNGYSETGLASWYGQGFHGKRTSSGEPFDMDAMTAAHKKLPMNTLLLVKNLENGRETIVRVNDRGPFTGKRIIDLSRSAAKALKLEKPGTARVKVTVLAGSAKEMAKELPPSATLDLPPGKFFIQVGAFSRERNAADLQKRFADAGHTAVIRKISGKKSTLYRVHVFVGKDSDKDKALIAEKTMRDKGYKEAFVVVR